MPILSNLRFWPHTDIGRHRKHNEDSFLVDRKLSLFIVADGMGGHAAGEVASQMATRAVRECLAKERQLLADFEAGSKDVTRTEVLRLFESAVQEACAAVYNEGQRDESKRGMGTTLVALMIIGSRGFIAHVGDSRIYLLRQGAAHQLTDDHSLINELVKRGKLSPEQLSQIQAKNAVTRAVGVYESVEVDVLDFDVLAGDVYLLCSDGLHGYLTDGELQRFFRTNNVEECSERLVKLANDRGGRDNITTIVVEIPATVERDTLAEDVHLKIETLQKMPLFRFLSYQEIVRVLNLTEARRASAGEVVVKKGADGDELFILLSGGVRVHDGDTEMASLGAGQHFGEMALIDRAPRSATVTCTLDSQFLVLKRKSFFEIVRHEHALAVKLLWSFTRALTERLRTTSRDLGQARERLTFAPDAMDFVTVDLEADQG